MIRFMEARDEFNRLSPEEKNVCMEQQRKQLIDHLMQLKGDIFCSAIQHFIK